METNSLFVILKGFVDDPPTFYYKGRFFKLSAPDLPWRAGIGFVRGLLTAYWNDQKAKDVLAKAAQPSAPTSPTNVPA